jgi:hypothetical protein
VFLRKGEKLTKDSTGTRHPLPSDETTTRGADGTSSSSGETVIWGGLAGPQQWGLGTPLPPVELLPPAGPQQ